MKRRVVQCLALAVFAGYSAVPAPGGEPKGLDARKEAIRKELEKLEGTWKVLSREVKRTNTPAEEVKDLQLTIKGDRWTMTHSRGVDKAIIKIDPAQEPKTIDWTFTALGAMGKTLKPPAGRKIVSRGIYKLVYTEGDGETLTVCRVDQPRVARPKEFKTTENAGLLFVFKRESK
jgi:uncharacterized protein (TIGR03067 family)